MSTISAKVVFLGATMVGKTSIIASINTEKFDPDSPPTVGAAHIEKTFDFPDKKVSLQIWDTAGQEKFRTFAPLYFRGADVAVLVFSLTDEQSLQDVSDWHEYLKEQVDSMPVVYVVGNKLDLADQRAVETVRGEQVAKNIDACYFECSAKTRDGVDELFVRVAETAGNEAQKRSANKENDKTQATVDIGKSGSDEKKKKKRSWC